VLSAENKVQSQQELPASLEQLRQMHGELSMAEQPTAEGMPTVWIERQTL
ncbi:unnamed protein product, partial [Scytosiphon promiscuus]